MNELFGKTAEAINDMRVRWPELWGKCLPRRIVPPAGYPKTDYYAAHMLSFKLMRPNDTSGVVMLTNELIRLGVPTYFIGEEFARAVAATEPPDDFTLSQIRFPLDAMLLVFPIKFMMEYLGGYASSFVAVGKVQAQDEKMVCHCPVYIKGEPIDYSFAYSTTRTIKSVIETDEFVDWSAGLEELKDIAPDINSERILNRKINALTIKIMLALTARTNLIETGVILRKEKRNNHGELERDALWSANVIGRQYHPQRRKLGGETGEVKRMHWRRGHFRNQIYGSSVLPKEQRPHQLVWIEPVLVNAPE